MKLWLVVETLKRSVVNFKGKNATILKTVSLEHIRYPEKSKEYFSVSNHEYLTVPHTYEPFVLMLQEFNANGFVLSQLLQVVNFKVVSIFVVSIKIVVSLGKESTVGMASLTRQPSQLYSFEQLETVVT